MKTTGVIALVAWSIVLALAAGATLAGEQPLRFVHVLQQSGYGDMAVEYLKILERRADLPPELRDRWDLEMSKSLQAAADAAFDAKEAEVLLAESRQRLAKFLHERPDHPDALGVLAAWGEFPMKRGLESLRAAKLAEGKDSSQYETLLADARVSFDDARQKFQQAQKQFQTRLAKLPPPSKLPSKKSDRTEVAEARQQAEASLYETQLKLALIDYYLAQTYPDPKGPERTAALKQTTQALDAVFQQNRNNVIGLYAHMWHGKTAEELGDLRLARDIYDEVLANAPEPADRGPATGLEPLFTQAERFRLIVVGKQQPQQYLLEAAAWLKEYRRLKQTEGYQGVALDWAKAMLAAAAEAPGPRKAKLTGEVLQAVGEWAKVRGPYQQELALMRREILKTSGRDLEADSFEEAVALGDAAAAATDWQQALAAYRRAIELAEKTKLKNPGGIAAVHEATARVQFMIARELYVKGKLSECREMAEKIARDERGNAKKQSAAAPEAAALAVAAALGLYAEASAEQKPAALKKLLQAAEFTESNWPDKPQADDARMARGQAKLVDGQVREAIAIFERVNPKSQRYAAARYLAGQSYWRLYAVEKAKPQAAADSAGMVADRAQAVKCLEAARDALEKQAEPGKLPSKPLLAAQLLLAEIHYYGGQFPEAAALYRPLVEMVKVSKPQTLDAEMQAVLRGAARTHAALHELDKAKDAIALLFDLGPDTPQTNDVLVDFAKQLNGDRPQGDAAAQKSLEDILLKLSQRRSLSIGQMLFVGETLNALGKTADASRQFQAILHRMETDPEFAKTAAKAMSLLRTDLLTALRKQQKYNEALKQVDQLIRENPRALEPLVEKGRILDAWAKNDPAKLRSAVEHWVTVRNRLQAMRKKPDEYYEATYGIADCLVREAEAGKGKPIAVERASQAEKVLKAALVLSPRLSGPDAVAKYRALLDKAIAAQERPPTQVETKGERKP